MKRVLQFLFAVFLMAVLTLLGNGCTFPLEGEGSPEFDLEQVSLVRVVDGDTIVVQHADGHTSKVRLIGIDAPESVSSNESENCAEGEAASAYVSSILSEGMKLWLQKDTSDTDKYERLLRYVWIEYPTSLTDYSEVKAKMLNAIIVSAGHAVPYCYEPDVAYAEIFEKLAL